MPHVMRAEGALNGVFAASRRAVAGQLGEAITKPGPLLGDDYAVLGAVLVVAHGAGETGADLGGIDDFAHSGDVLRALVFDAGDSVVVFEEGKGAAVAGIDFADVEQHAVDEAAGLGEGSAAGAFDFIGSGTAAANPPGNAGGDGHDKSQPGGSFPSNRGREGHCRWNRNTAAPKKRIQQVWFRKRSGWVRLYPEMQCAGFKVDSLRIWGGRARLL